MTMPDDGLRDGTDIISSQRPPAPGMSHCGAPGSGRWSPCNSDEGGGWSSDEGSEVATPPPTFSPLQQLLSQRSLLASFNLDVLPAPEAGLGQDLAESDGGASWASVAALPRPPEHDAGVMVVAGGPAVVPAVPTTADLPFRLLGPDTNLSAGLPREFSASNAGRDHPAGAPPVVSAAAATPTSDDTDVSVSVKASRQKRRSRMATKSSGAGRGVLAAANPFSALAGLDEDVTVAAEPQRAAPLEHWWTKNFDDSVDSDGEDEPAHFVSSTDTLNRIFTLPYCDSDVSIVLHRVGQMLLMEGTLNGLQLGSGDMDDLGKSDPQADQKEKAELEARFLFYSSAAQDSETPAPTGRSFHPSGATSHTATGVPGRRGSVDSFDSRPGEGSGTESAGSFRHKFMWEFRDYQMMLGSDMIVFSNSKHPKFSMQLHDVDQEISSLACLELWMNNVFQSVPETGICCHKDGCVQGYKLMNTHDLPHLSDGGSTGSFQPAAVMARGASIMDFLHTHCAEDGGTYWLYRDGSEEGELKLYEVNLGSSATPTSVEPPEDKLTSTSTGAEDLSGNSSPAMGDDGPDYRATTRDLPTVDTEQGQQMASAVATLCYRMAERFGDEGSTGSQEHETDAPADGRFISRRRRLYRRCAQLVDPTRNPMLWLAANEKLGVLALAPLCSLRRLSFHSARALQISAADPDTTRHRNAAITGAPLTAAIDGLRKMAAAHKAADAAAPDSAAAEQAAKRLALTICRACLWLAHRCLFVGCAVPGVADSEAQPDVGSAMHQLVLASWWLERSGVAQETEPGNLGANGGREGRAHALALLLLTASAFVELAQGGVRACRLGASAGPAMERLAAARAMAGLRGEDTTRLNTAAACGLDAQTMDEAVTAGGWLGRHCVTAIAPCVDAEQNFNKAVQLLLRALRLCAPASTPAATPATDVVLSKQSPDTKSVVAVSVAQVSDGDLLNTDGDAEENESDEEDTSCGDRTESEGRTKRTAPFSGGRQDLVVVAGASCNEGEGGDSAAVLGMEVSTALGATYHALGALYTATGRRTKAHRHCQQGISLFQSISDVPNVALCMAAIGRIVRVGMAEHELTPGGCSTAGLDTLTTALSWYRQARDQLVPRESYPRTWAAIRAELVPTAASAAALLQQTLPHLALQQREDAARSILTALDEAGRGYREMLGSMVVAAHTQQCQQEQQQQERGSSSSSALRMTTEQKTVAAHLGVVEHQLGLFHGWRAVEAHIAGGIRMQQQSPCDSEAERRRVTLRKTSLSQAHRHLREALEWTCTAATAETTAATTTTAQQQPQQSAAGVREPSSPRSPTKAGAATSTFVQPNLAALRKYLGAQLEAVSSGGVDKQVDHGSGGANSVGGVDAMVAKELRQAIQVSVRVSVQAARSASHVQAMEQGLRSTLRELKDENFAPT